MSTFVIQYINDSYWKIGIIMFWWNKPVLSQEEKIRLIKLWVTGFEIARIRQIASVQEPKWNAPKSGAISFFCKIEGKEFMGRTGYHKQEALAVDEALRHVKDMVETEVTQILGKVLT